MEKKISLLRFSYLGKKSLKQTNKISATPTAVACGSSYKVGKAVLALKYFVTFFLSLHIVACLVLSCHFAVHLFVYTCSGILWVLSRPQNTDWQRSGNNKAASGHQCVEPSNRFRRQFTDTDITYIPIMMIFPSPRLDVRADNSLVSWRLGFIIVMMMIVK